ncbi:transposase [Desulfosarcina sp. BuS5]|uniref:transposase n=1 Tax=Desulfosarcina sp. BuS5 TaxID=933262 RepID=UPI0012FCD252|nr:transposase [Desulfosarcina sp. BuS5]
MSLDIRFSSIIPKYRQKVFYGKMRRRVCRILRELCKKKGWNYSKAMPNHIHLCLSISPKQQCLNENYHVDKIIISSFFLNEDLKRLAFSSKNVLFLL